MFTIPQYTHPDFSGAVFQSAPDVRTEIVQKKGVAPENFHATSMYPEYFKIEGKWKLTTGSRMDCVPVVCRNGRIEATEVRRLEKGDRVILGRTEDGSEGIFLYTEGFH